MTDVFLDGGRTDFKVSIKEAKSFTGFCADVIDMAVLHFWTLNIVSLLVDHGECSYI